MRTSILTILLFISIISNAQNPSLAKSYYEKAKTSLESESYEQALDYIEKSKEYAGSTNPDIMYVELKARLKTDFNINKAKALTTDFLKDAFEDDDRRNEVSNIFIEIENSDKYYYNGNRKEITEVSSDKSEKCTKYFKKRGWVYQTFCYTNNSANTLLTKTYWKGKDVLDRKETYYKGSLLSETDYYENNSVKWKIETSTGIFILDDFGNVIQKYDLDYKNNNYIKNFKHSGDFKSGEFVWKNDRWGGNDLYEIEFYPNTTMTYNYSDFIYTLGVIKKGKRFINRSKNEYEIMKFDESGIALTKEYWKKGKRKKTYTWSVYGKYWKED